MNALNEAKPVNEQCNLDHESSMKFQFELCPLNHFYPLCFRQPYVIFFVLEMPSLRPNVEIVF